MKTTTVSGRSDHARRECRLERVIFDLRGAKQSARRAPRRRDDQERRAGRLRKLGEPRVDELLERLGQAEGPDRIAAPAVGVERAGQREREERVPARGFVEAKERRPREASAELRLQDAVESARAERADAQVGRSALVERTLQLRRRDAVTEPAGEEDADVVLGQSPQRKGERARRRRIQPLHVVDRDEERLAVGEQLQRRADGHGKGAEVDRLLRVVPQEQGDLERAPPRCRQLGQHVGERVLEQVSQPGMGDSELDLGGPGGEDAQPALPRRLDTGEPERRLPDPGLALQDERRRASAASRPRKPSSAPNSSSRPTISTAISCPSS